MAINGAAMPYAAPSLSVVILTFNESKHIVRALKSLAPLKVKAFVVDSFSTDNTVELAAASGAHVVQHTFVNQAKQFGWAPRQSAHRHGLGHAAGCGRGVD